MKQYQDRWEVVGTNALKPDCSRYSNENERIIEFPQHRSEGHGRSIRDRAVHVSRKAYRAVDRSDFAADMRYGSLKGKPIGRTPRWLVGLAGGIYTAMAIAALFFAV